MFKKKKAKAYCIAFSCLNNNKYPKLSFFTLPTDIERFVSNARWVLSKPACRRMSGKDLVDLTVDVDGVGVLTIQHPPTNSMSLAVMQEMCKSLDEVEKNKCTGMILTSSSPKIFSAGLDMMELYKPDPIRLEDYYFTIQELWIKLFGANFPTAAAINGHSPGGGCLLALSCEFRAMVGGPYKIGLNEVALGIVVPSWASYTMLNVISQRECEAALTTAKMWSVDEAKKVGIIDEIAADKEDAIAKCKEFIKKFAHIPPIPRAITKRNLRQAPLEWMKKYRQADLKEFLERTQSPEVQKYIEMFIQRLKQKSMK